MHPQISGKERLSPGITRECRNFEKIGVFSVSLDLCHTVTAFLLGCHLSTEMVVAAIVRKILVSVKFVSAILGPEMGAPILWTPGKMRSFCRKNHVHKIPRFRGGGYFGFFGGGKSRFYLWVRGFF